LLAAIIGNSGFITRHYNAISRGCVSVQQDQSDEICKSFPFVRR
jgi:hypothetical protein